MLEDVAIQALLQLDYLFRYLTASLQSLQLFEPGRRCLRLPLSGRVFFFLNMFKQFNQVICICN